MPGGEIIEEEERRRAVHGNVIDAVVHQIRAHGVMAIEGEGELQLGADAIDAGDQHGVAGESLQREESAEGADLPQNTGAEGAAGQLLDAGFGFACGVDIDAGVAIAHRRRQWLVLSV